MDNTEGSEIFMPFEDDAHNQNTETLATPGQLFALATSTSPWPRDGTNYIHEPIVCEEGE